MITAPYVETVKYANIAATQTSLEDLSMKRIALTIIMTLPVTGAATNTTVKPWEALSGDTLLIDGQVVTLKKAACPNVSTAAGLDAKRLANLYLNGRHVRCIIETSNVGRFAECRLQGNNGNTLSDTLIQSGHCQPTAMPPVMERRSYFQSLLKKLKAVFGIEP